MYHVCNFYILLLLLFITSKAKVSMKEIQMKFKQLDGSVSHTTKLCTESVKKHFNNDSSITIIHVIFD